MSDLVTGVVGFATLLGAITAIEWITPVERYSLRSRLPGLAFWVAYFAFGWSVVYGLQRLWSGLGISSVVTLPVTQTLGQAGGILCAVIVGDFLAYWHHRALHRWAWPVHVVHHSQTELHAANGYGHFLEQATAFLLITTPLSLVTFDAFQPLAVVALLQLLQFYIHAPTTAHLGPLRRVIVDNRFHRIHHSTDERHFDKNFSILFSVWDRLFGTAYDPAPDEWPETGVAGMPPPKTVPEYLLYPLRYQDSRVPDQLVQPENERKEIVLTHRKSG